MKDHPAVLAAIAAAALIAARLLAISRFDVNTAAMILQVSGTGTALAGTALTLLPFALVGSTCFLALVVFVDPSLVRTGFPAEWMLSLAIAAAVCLVALWLLVPTMVVVLTAAWLGRRWRRRGYDVSIARTLRSSRLLRMEATLLLVVAAMAPLVLQRPWMPLQEVTGTEGTVIVGYVLGEAEGRIVVMDDDDRTIRLLDPDDIRSRRICEGGARPGGLLSGAPRLRLSGSALGFLLWGDQTPSYPPCPD